MLSNGQEFMNYIIPVDFSEIYLAKAKYIKLYKYIKLSIFRPNGERLSCFPQDWE